MFTLCLEYFNFFFFILHPHFHPLLLSPLSQSSHSSFLPVASFNSSTRHRPKPLPSTDNADWPLRSLPLSLFYLIFPLLCLSIFLRLKRQDPRSLVLGFDFVAVIDKTGFDFVASDWVLCWWVLFLFWWMSFDFVNGWWMRFVDGGWVSLVLWWLLANLMVDDWFYFYFDEWVLILLMVDEWGLLMVDEW